MSLFINIILSKITIFLLLLLQVPAGIIAQQPQIPQLQISSFNSSHYDILDVLSSATISNGALQITPDSLNNVFVRQHKSGRILYKTPFKMWEEQTNIVASFNTSFLINIYRSPNTIAGEGFAFIIAPDLSSPPIASEAQYLGLTNSTLDGLSSNQLVALELDTVKQDFDPDDNHMGLDLNSIRSNTTVSLSNHNIEIAPLDPKNYTVWIQYDGVDKVFKAYMALEGLPRPAVPLLDIQLNLRDYVNQQSYFGFAASTGNWTQLNCVLGWNLTVQILPQEKDTKWIKILVGVGVPGLLLLLVAILVLIYYLKKRRIRLGGNDTNILGALKSLPGTPREFRFKDLKRATNNFDDKNKLGQGGFGVVYKGVLPKENMEVAVKKFSRESMKGKDDFLAELTIINRLRHKHLVKLVGWCHTNGMLLLVYDFMPNGSLDNHLFNNNEEKTRLGWDRRYKIISGVASALHYLHNEYDQKVVHRDLKASNVMLDSDYNARLGDFGLARAIDNEKTSYAELEQGVPGTPGYIAPECFHMGRATRESDVFGFGAVVLEVVCGQRPWTKIAGFQFLADWVWTLHREGRILEAVDEKLEKDFVEEEAERLLLLGLACSHPIASERPKTQTIIQILSGAVPPPRVPPFKPAFVWPMMGPGDDSNTSNNTQDTTPMSSSYSGWTPRENYTGYSDNSFV
ncbi:hypothetical protein AQUCO_09500048v1 [Aquilegia coerulea]|uniref:Protein kinase domain-containing protein n=1 Tax=Aquilegia coerulea TaxID=218851 RepID=A0A2G5C4Z9_AQUCA|nr:hypothetical protein AQUCO_09500048v1 [Aquilegia coerulea]